jgi:hypothetical protein
LFDPDGGMARWVRLALAARRLAVSRDWSLATWATVAVEAMAARYERNARTAATVTAESRRLFRYLQAMGVERLEGMTCELVTRWCWAARPDRAGRLSRVNPTTARQRQWYALACGGEAHFSGPLSALTERLNAPTAGLR